MLGSYDPSPPEVSIGFLKLGCFRALGVLFLSEETLRLKPFDRNPRPSKPEHEAVYAG